jgi:hypothetical protein
MKITDSLDFSGDMGSETTADGLSSVVVHFAGALKQGWWRIKHFDGSAVLRPGGGLESTRTDKGGPIPEASFHECSFPSIGAALLEVRRIVRCRS